MHVANADCQSVWSYVRLTPSQLGVRSAYQGSSNPSTPLALVAGRPQRPTGSQTCR